MKALDQVEPRTPISSLPYVVTQPGSYYLTRNLVSTFVGGLTVSNNNVTLDLMGFELSSEDGSTIISVPGSRTNITILNGTFRNGGIAAQDSGIRGRDLHVIGGVLFCGPFSQLSQCSVSGSTDRGIRVGAGSMLNECTVSSNRVQGFDLGPDSFMTRCTSRQNGTGIAADVGARIIDCLVSSNRSVGIRHDGRGVIRGCTVTENGSDGIELQADSLILENVCSENGRALTTGAGIRTQAAGNRIEGNQCILNDVGIVVEGVNSLILRNTCRFNTSNYQIGNHNRYGPIVNITASGTVGASGSGPFGSTLNSADPWANFSF